MPEQRMFPHKAVLLSLDQHLRKAISVFALYPFIVLMILVVFSMVLSSVYHSHLINQSLLQQPRTSIADLASREASLLNQQLMTISDLVRIARPEHDYYFSLPRSLDLPLQSAEPVFATTQGSAFYKAQDNGGASLYYPGVNQPQPEQQWKARNTERLDSLYKAIVNSSEVIEQAYFNSWDNMTRVYPYIANIHHVFSQSLPVSESHIYYLADAKHNPERELVWTSAYQNLFDMGWKLSAIIPVYQGDFLEGVFGIDINLNKLISSMRDRNDLSGRHILLLDKDSQIIAISDEFTPALQQTFFVGKEAANSVNVKGSGHAQIQHQLLDWVHTGENLLEIEISGRNFVLSKTEIAETQWQLVVAQDLSDVTLPVQSLLRTERAISLSGLLLLVTLAGLYFRVLHQRTRHFAHHLSSSIQQLTAWTSSLGHNEEINTSNPVNSRITEVAALVENVRRMIARLQDRNEQLLKVQLAEQLSAEKARLFQQMARTDQLTHLYNRNYLDTALRQHCTSQLPDRNNLCIMLIDIDHFNKVNDLYGHQAGDYVLKKVAQCLKDKTRANDIPGRWGGEEFLVICPNTSLTEAGVIADYLRSEIAALDLVADHKVTISVGIAQLRAEERAEQTIARAATMLYKSKLHGCNLVSQ